MSICDAFLKNPFVHHIDSFHIPFGDQVYLRLERLTNVEKGTRYFGRGVTFFQGCSHGEEKIGKFKVWHTRGNNIIMCLYNRRSKLSS